MQKKPTPIRWRKKDVEKMKREVRNYNRRLQNLEKKAELFLGDVVLPEKISFKDLQKDIFSRADFNKSINRMKRFEGARSEFTQTAQGITVTKYTLKEMAISKRTATRKRNQRAKEFADTPVIVDGFDTGTTWGEQAETENTKPREFDLQDQIKKAETPKELLNLMRRYETQSSDLWVNYKNEIYHNNYISVLYSYNFDKHYWGRELIKFINTLPPEVVYWGSTRPTLEIGHLYDLQYLSDSEVDDWLHSLYENWQTFYREVLEVEV